MTKKQNIILNYIVLIVILFSYAILKIYTDFRYLQTIQKVFVFAIFLSSLVLMANNFIYFKQVSKKISPLLLLCIGLILAIYSGVALYLILALQNISF